MVWELSKKVMVTPLPFNWHSLSLEMSIFIFEKKGHKKNLSACYIWPIWLIFVCKKGLFFVPWNNRISKWHFLFIIDHIDILISEYGNLIVQLTLIFTHCVFLLVYFPYEPAFQSSSIPQRLVYICNLLQIFNSRKQKVKRNLSKYLFY